MASYEEKSCHLISSCSGSILGSLGIKHFLEKNKISIDGIHERFSPTKQCSALLGFYFMCHLVGENSRRSLSRLLVHGETLSLKAERASLLRRGLAGSVLTVAAPCRSTALLPRLLSGLAVKRRKMRLGRLGEWRSREIFAWFCGKMGAVMACRGRQRGKSG